MKKLLQLFIFMVLITLNVQADNNIYTVKQKISKINFGQAIFRKKLQRKCGYTASYWAQQHTLLEWKMIQHNGNFKNELLTMCPKSIKVVEEKWIESLYLFAKEYAKDTGNRPRC